MRGVTARIAKYGAHPRISTHTPHARRDHLWQTDQGGAGQFLLTRLMRGVTSCERFFSFGVEFLLTRLMRGVTSCSALRSVKGSISTHTPHARRDG